MDGRRTGGAGVVGVLAGAGGEHQQAWPAGQQPRPAPGAAAAAAAIPPQTGGSGWTPPILRAAGDPAVAAASGAAAVRRRPYPHIGARLPFAPPVGPGGEAPPALPFLPPALALQCQTTAAPWSWMGSAAASAGSWEGGWEETKDMTPLEAAAAAAADDEEEEERE